MEIDALTEFSKIYHHKFIVLKYMMEYIHDLLKRTEEHDNSKFSEEEFPSRIVAIKEFEAHPYGSPEHSAVLKKYEYLTTAHYKKNRHHPEHFENGIDDMTLVDLLELLADWKAASLKEPNENISNSINIGNQKYNISPQLLKILENTAKEYKM